jgi:peptidoglycan hydrolase-like protein with peptidoglycan-binding domain
MRRFSLALILALLFTYALLPERGGQSTNNAASQQPAASQAGSAAPAQREATVSAPGDLAARNQPVEPAATAAPQPETAAASADSETVAPAHIQSSVDASASEPAFAAMSGADLIMSAQKQLAKLGCYKAGVDGIWGRKSRQAVREFNRRTGGNWDDDPTRGLISALRSAPAGLCELPCADGGGAVQCKTVSAPKDGKRRKGEKGETQGYLPPWMRGGDQTASIAPETVGAATSSDARVGLARRDTSADRKKVRRASEKRYRTAEQIRPAKRTDNWNLVNWPGTAD